MTATRSYRFRAPLETPQPTLYELLERAASTDQGLDEALLGDRVHVDRRAVRDGEVRPAADSLIEAELPSPEERWDMPRTSALARGEGWIVADKPAGMPGTVDHEDAMNPVLFLADALGADRKGFTPVWQMPDAAAGPWLFGTSAEAAEDLRQRWQSGDLMATWVALTPEPERPGGRLAGPEGLTVQYSATTIRNGIAELQATPRPEGDPPDVSPVETVLDALAERGIAALGDRRRAGYLTPGPLRFRLAALFEPETPLQHSWPAPDDWWPTDPIVPAARRAGPAGRAGELGQLTVSTELLRSLRDGTVRRIRSDEILESPDDFHSGALARADSPEEIAGPLVMLDGREPAAAWVWSNGAADVDLQSEVERRFDRAIGARRPFIRRLAECDLFRLVHGAADGLPGVYIDRVGPRWLVRREGEIGRSLFDRIDGRLGSFAPRTDRVFASDAGAASDPDDARGSASVVARESGVRFRLGRGLDAAASISPVRRPIRRAVREHPQVDRWLHLAPEGGGSAAVAAAAGADVVAPCLTAEHREWIENQTLAGSVLPLESPFEQTTSAYGAAVLDLDIVEEWFESRSAETVSRRLQALLGSGAPIVAYRCQPCPDHAARRTDGPEMEEIEAAFTHDRLDHPPDTPPIDDPSVPPPLVASRLLVD
ncbi:MAG: hypothetical protein ABEL76_00975 [Bradymonadaceae bacterium]